MDKVKFLHDGVARREKPDHHEVIMIHPLRIMRVCIKCLGDLPSSDCWDITVWTKVVDQRDHY